VTLQPPLYPKDLPFTPLALYDGGPPPDNVTIITPEEAEYDVMQMADRATDDDFGPRRWLTDLLFAADWGPQGKPSVFLSFPKGAASDAALIRKTLENRFHFVMLQDADVDRITEGAIERIVQAHCFIGIWYPERIKGAKASLSPWMPFEYGVALSHNKECVILSHDSLPGHLADRIARDTARIQYNNLATEPEKLKELERRCEPWNAAHRRLSLTSAKRPMTGGAATASPAVTRRREQHAGLCITAKTASDACAARERGEPCDHERRSNSMYCGCHSFIDGDDGLSGPS
jgi:hypothetical protein